MEQQSQNTKRVIVLAVDNSVPSELAFEFYLKNVYRPGYYLHVVNHSDCWTNYTPPTEGVTHETHCKDIMDKESAKVKVVEEKYLKLMKDQEIPGEFFVLHGKDAWHDIVSHQERMEALMIVMGTRGQGALQRTFRGSVSDSVVHHATCPVLVCCHPKH